MRFCPVWHLISSVIIILSVLIALDALVTTQTGLRWIFFAAEHLVPGELSASNVEGTFLGTMHLQNLHYHNTDMDVVIADVQLSWQPDAVWQRKLLINTLHVNGVTWSDLSAKSSHKFSLPSLELHLPFTIWIADLQLKNCVVLPENIHLQMSGSLTTAWNLLWQVQQGKNTLQASGSIQGLRAAPIAQAVINAHNLALYDARIAALKARLVMNLATDKTAELKATGRNFQYADYRLDPINVHVQADFKRQSLQVQLGTGKLYSRAQQPLKNIMWQRGLLQAKKIKQGWQIQAELNNGSAAIPDYGVKLQAIQLKAIADPENITWFGSAVIGKGNMQVTGNTKIATADFSTLLHVQGNNIPIVYTTNYQVNITPDVDIKINAKQLDVNGKIFIPQALLQFGSENAQALQLSNDVVFTHEKSKASALPNLAVHAQLQLLLGDHVQLRFQGLHSRLGGNLLLTESPGQPATAVGQINLLDGEIVYSGQTLKIAPDSHFYYAGSDVADPILNIQAGKQVTALVQNTNIISNGTTVAPLPPQPTSVNVGINVRGTVSNPQITLFAQPAGLSQADILSYLLFDQPSSQMSGVNAELLFTAASSLNVGTGEFKQLVNSIQKTVGLNQLAIQSNPYFDPSTNTLQQNTSLVLGKALSPRLYVSYSVGLLQPINILQIRYLLSKYWSLQSTTGSLANGVDLLYTIEH